MPGHVDESKLNDILEKAERAAILTQEEIIYLLELQDKVQVEKVFQTARNIRRRFFSNKIFMYGFIYFSTFCRNDCTFCFYRKSNDVSVRYHKTEAEIMETAHSLTESGVHLLDLTMGEDPRYFSQGFKELLELVTRIKKVSNLPLMISPGLVPVETLDEFKKAGINWYACYQETHNRQLYERLRVGQSFDNRLKIKLLARERGLLVEEGLLTGVGETVQDLAESLAFMKLLSADQVRVMSFVPQKGTPMEGLSSPSFLRELLMIAVMRLVFPDKLIPASLDVDGIAGLKERLDAGANVVTSLIPPSTGFAGVSQSTLDIDEGHRTVQGILPILESCKLEPAHAREYAQWVKQRQTDISMTKREGVGLCG
ncbi:MAG: methylornithine synthase PylB [Bacillota bacterium]